MRPRHQQILALLACCLLLIAHGLIAWTSVIRESATYDEPLHAVAAHVIRYYHDFRVNPEDPPLWEYWAELPHAKDSLAVNTHSDVFDALLKDPPLHWRFVLETLYIQGHIDADAWLNQSRAMMLVFSLALGAMLAAVAWRAAGPFAAVISCGLYCVDPNFIGHAPLVKNDVVFTFAMFCMCAAMWGLLNRITFLRVLLVAICCGFGLCVKLSGTLLPVMLIAVLLLRVISSQPWGKYQTRKSRILPAIGILFITAAVSYLMIWACYGFRFSIAPDAHSDWQFVVRGAAYNRAYAAHPDHPPDAIEQLWYEEHPGLMVKTAHFALVHRLLPEGYVVGFLFMYIFNFIRATYLLGHNAVVGWRYYFPLAIAVKTPLATLVAIGLSTIYWLRHRTQQIWLLLAFGLPAAIYFAVAICANLNLGLRHVFPIYPAIFLLLGCTAASMRRRGIALLLAFLLLAETMLAYPHYISFFNAPATAYGPVKLLGDSNLDWGQDLPLLAQWQKQHPDQTLYLAYFGSAPPRYYGLRFIGLPGGYQFDVPTKDYRPTPGVIAISASDLQGIYMSPRLREFYRQFWNQKPLAVLGGTIFLYPTNGIAPPAD